MRDDNARAWWCPDGAPSELPTGETELVSAAMLCAALAETKASVSASEEHNEAAARELEARLRQSPLPHSLLLPVLEFTADYVLAESVSAFICAVRATKPTDIFDAVVSSALPLKKPTDRRFGGARIHAPFWKRAVRLNVEELYSRAQSANKPLFLCGHSIGGSIATLALCQLVYQHLPIATRLFLERKDTKRSTDVEKKLNFPKWLQLRAGATEQQAAAESVPQVIAVAFGAPYCGCEELGAFLDALMLRNRVVTFVNEFDCIPGVLNVAQSAALLTNTADRLQTIAKATALLLNLLPAGMQQQFLQLSATAGSAAVPSAASAYLSMSLTILQKSFDKLRELKVIKGIDYEYAPCGTYIFMAKGGRSFELHTDIESIRKALKEEEDDNSLTGNSVMQHFMREYVSAIARRSQSIQINETMNYYERLGVPRNATSQQIRSSYKALALKWHPDKWATVTVSLEERETAEGVFKLLAESYEVLSNAEARRAYDVHLDKPPSLRQEFMGAGTVRGKSLDEAIGTFRDVIDNLSAVGNRITSHFSSSSSTVVGHPLQHNGVPQIATTSHSVASGSHNCGGMTVDNHSNMFAPDRIRVARPVSTGTDAHDHIMYVKPNEVLPTDIPAPQILSASVTPPTSASSSTSSTVAPVSDGSPTSSSSSAVTTSGGLKTISVVGGAVAVAVSVAIIVSAWSQFTDVSRKKRQSSVVRQMPAECLVLLLEDHRSAQNSSMSAQSLLEEASKHKKEQRKGEKKKRASITNGEDPATDDAVVAANTNSGNDFQCALAFRAEVQKQEDALVEQFFECRMDHEKASVEALVEEQFYDCIELDSEVSQLFGSVTAKDEEKKPPGDVAVEEFPVGSTVNTPFGLGVIEVWGASRSAATVRFPSKGDALHCISRNDITRGASQALVELSAELETRRLVLADRVITNYSLDDAPRKRDTLKTLAVVGADGAIDTGIRAAGGVALANGMTRTTSAMGGMVAAPLTVASILVDIGKEYYDYRKKFSERKSLGVLSATSERLMRREFRLKTGEVVVSRTAAAAGAGLSAYGVASAMGVWAAAGVATGPIGIAAATSAAVVGGLIGFFGGSKVYSLSTKSYFTSHRHAKEHIDRLELGARVLFEEFDPTGTGEITKEECLIIMTKLYEASGGISDKGYEATVAALTDPKFEGPVTWRMFWLWVSTEASRALRKLDSKDVENSSSDSESGRAQSPSSPSARERKRDLLRKFVSDAKHKRADIKSFGHEFMAAAKAEKEMKKQRKLLKRKAEKEASASPSSPPSPSSTSDPGSPASVASNGSETLSDALHQLELLEQNEVLSADQAQHLRDDLQSDDVAQQVAATEIVGALAADKDAEPEAGYEIVQVDGKDSNETMGLVVPVTVRPVVAAESEGALVAVPENAVTTTSSLKKPPATATPAPSRKARAQVDERLDVLCSLLSAQGIERLLAMQNIVPEEKEAAGPPTHEELHLLALATAATPSTTTI